MDSQLIRKVTSALSKMQYSFSNHTRITQLKGGITNKIYLMEFPNKKFIDGNFGSLKMWIKI